MVKTLIVLTIISLALTKCHAGVIENLPEKEILKNEGVQPKEIVIIGDKEYFISSGGFLDAVNATRLCNSMEMSLVSFETEEEMLAIHDYLEFTGLAGNIYWTSGRKFSDAGDWIWQGSGQLFGFTNWGFNKPESTLPDPCVFFNRYGGWSDYSCTSTETRVMCESLRAI